MDNGIGGKLSTKMDHLAFYGGLLALGATGGLTLNEAQSLKSWNEEEADFKLGEELTYTCYKMYHDVSQLDCHQKLLFSMKILQNPRFYY